jgi:hypothetical protein
MVDYEQVCVELFETAPVEKTKIAVQAFFTKANVVLAADRLPEVVRHVETCIEPEPGAAVLYP